MDIGEAEIAPLKTKRQSLVIDPEAFQDRGIQIVNMNWILHDVVAVIIGRTITDPWLESTAGHPHGKAAAVMIATIIVVRKRALRIDCTSELAPKNNQRIFEQSALFQIHHKRRTRLIHILALSADLLGKIAVLIPATVHKLDKSHSALHHSASQ